MLRADHEGQQLQTVVHRSPGRTVQLLAVLGQDSQAGHPAVGSPWAFVGEGSQARPC
jgi:hypothetical protein